MVRPNALKAEGNIGQMANLGRRMHGWWAAMLLAALTLSVFSVLQNYGPESAVRRFHEAAVNRDVEMLARVSTADLRNEWTRYLAAQIDGTIRSGTKIRIQRTLRQPQTVLVEVIYFMPNKQRTVRWWQVDRQPNGAWRVNPKRTVELARMSLGL